VFSNQCGLSCEVNPDSIKTAIEEYVNHPDKVSQQGLKGRQVVSQSNAVTENAVTSFLNFVSSQHELRPHADPR
jgi:hypothetical protein